jgi:hypothetical protein
LQIQFQRRMAHGLQALVSYNLAKASDTASNDGTGFAVPSISQVMLPPLTPSDFDIRNSVSAAVSYEIPAPALGRAGKAILGGWAVDALVQISSAPPITVFVSNQTSVIGYNQQLADVVPGQLYWIPDSSQPAGKALNPVAFSIPAPRVQENFLRNSIRSPYSVNQTDIAVRRRFTLSDRFKLNLRAEYFNVFNHPMFGAPGANQPDTGFGTPTFGKVDDTMNEDLGGGGAYGGQSTLYGLGGPRSAQFTIKLQF